MPSPIFDKGNISNGPAQGGGIFGLLFNRMYQRIPEFRDFANSMQGMSESEMIQKSGVNPAEVEKAKKDPAAFLSGMGFL